MLETDLLRALGEVRIPAHDTGTSGCSKLRVNNWMLSALSSGALYLPSESLMQIHEEGRQRLPLVIQSSPDQASSVGTS